MRRHLGIVVVLLGVIPAGGVLSGCSLFGYAIGDMIDSGQEVDSAVDCARSAMVDVAVGDSVGIDLLDARYVAGTFVALTLEDSATYLKRCVSSQEQLAMSAGFPLPGDSILIVGNSGDCPIRVVEKIAWYDRTELRQYRADGDLWATPHGAIDTAFFRDGGILTGAWLREAAREGLLPFPGGEMSILRSTQVVRVPLDSVAAFHLAAGGNAASIGMQIGAIVDVACVTFAAFIAASMSEAKFDFSGGY